MISNRQPDLPTATSRREGEIYVIDYGNGTSFKIGMTTRGVQERFKQISKGNVLMPMYLVMSGYVDNCRQVENLLHMKFEDLRINGEWFNLNFPDLVEIHQILSLLGFTEVYEHWYQLVPKDYKKYRQFVLDPRFPCFKPEHERMCVSYYPKFTRVPTSDELAMLFPPQSEGEPI